LCSTLKKVLLDLPRTNERVFPLEGSYVSRLFKKYIRKAGIPDILNIHSLRHTALTHIVDQSKDIMAAKIIAGHSTVKVTDMYTHTPDNRIREALESLPY